MTLGEGNMGLTYREKGEEEDNGDRGKKLLRLA